MKIKTSVLTGAALDWAVAKCEGFKPAASASLVIMDSYHPSTYWAQGGPIIEREEIELRVSGKNWWADRVFKPSENRQDWCGHGSTPLIAAMRCYVASKLGDEVEVPKDMT